MGKKFEDIQTSYMYLLDSYLEARLAFIVYSGFVKRNKKNPLNEDDSFIHAVILSCIKTIVLILGNHLTNNSDSITLNCLENLVRNSRAQFDKESYKQALNVFSDLNEVIASNNELVQRIVAYRNQIIAHIDRIRVNNPAELLARTKLSLDDFEKLLALIGSFLNEIGSIFGITNTEEDLIQIGNYQLEQETFAIFDFIKDFRDNNPGLYFIDSGN